MKLRRIQSEGQDRFSKGDQGEVKASNGVYYHATVLRSPSPMQKNMVLVEYQPLYDYEGQGANSKHLKLKGYVDLTHVRLLPPRDLNRCFKPRDSVDAYCDNGWRTGVVKDILENSKYVVCFDFDDGDGTKDQEERKIEHYNLRLHREWDDALGSHLSLTPTGSRRVY